MENVISFLIDAIVNDRTIQDQYPDQYRFFNAVETAIDEAWNIWDEEILSSFYEDEKPEVYTDEFAIQWIENEDFIADGFDVEWIEELFINN